MSDAPGTVTGMESASKGGNPFTTLAQRPRLMLVLLAGWSILTVLTQTLTSSSIFLENHSADGLELDGLLGGLALGWQGIPLAAIYIYSFRNPGRYRPVFLLALIHMGALSAAQLYHLLIRGNFTIESVFVPLVGSVALGALVLVHLFQPREEPPAPHLADEHHPH